MHLVLGFILFVFGALVPVSSIAAQVSPTASPVMVDVKGVSLVHVPDKKGVVRVVIQGSHKDHHDVVPHHLYLMIDNSASMGGPRNLAVKKALLAVNEYLKQNAPDLPVSVMTFDDTAREIFAHETREQKLIRFSNIIPDGGTEFGPAVQLLKEKFNQSSAIPLAILLTDGDSSYLKSQTFAPLKGFQTELVGVGVGVNMDALLDVAKSLNTGLHYLPDDTKILLVGSPEQSPLGDLAKLMVSRIKDVVVGPMTIKAHIPQDSFAKFIGSSLSTHVISADGRQIEVTIPSLADEEKAVVDLYVDAVVNGQISVVVAPKEVELVTTKINEYKDNLEHMDTVKCAVNMLKTLKQDLQKACPQTTNSKVVQDQLGEAIEEYQKHSQFNNALSSDFKQEIERRVIAIRYNYVNSTKTQKGLHLEQDLVFEKSLIAKLNREARIGKLKQTIQQSTSNDGLAQALSAFMDELRQEPNHDLVAQLLSAMEEMAKEFKMAAEKGLALEEGKRFLLASIHNGADNHVSNTPGASQGTKAQKSFREKFLDNAKSALISAGKDAIAVEAFGSMLSALPTKSALRSLSAKPAPRPSSEKPVDADGSSGSVSDIRSRFEKKQ